MLAWKIDPSAEPARLLLKARGIEEVPWAPIHGFARFCHVTDNSRGPYLIIGAATVSVTLKMGGVYVRRMATRLSKQTERRLKVCLKTAEAMIEANDEALESSYWNGYRVAAQQFLRILGGAES
jgi:hypothetical protein